MWVPAFGMGGEGGDFEIVLVRTVWGRNVPLSLKSLHGKLGFLRPGGVEGAV